MRGADEGVLERYQALRTRGKSVIDDYEGAEIVEVDGVFHHLEAPRDAVVSEPYESLAELLRKRGRVVLRAPGGVFIEWRPDRVYAVTREGEVLGWSDSPSRLAEEFGPNVFQNAFPYCGAFWVHELFGLHFSFAQDLGDDWPPTSSLRTAIESEDMARYVEDGSRVTSSRMSVEELMDVLTLFHDGGPDEAIVHLNGERVRFRHDGPPERVE